MIRLIYSAMLKNLRIFRLTSFEPVGILPCVFEKGCRNFQLRQPCYLSLLIGRFLRTFSEHSKETSGHSYTGYALFFASATVEILPFSPELLCYLKKWVAYLREQCIGQNILLLLLDH